MRKKLFLLLLTIVCCICLALGISACNGTNDEPVNEVSASTEENSGGGTSEEEGSTAELSYTLSDDGTYYIVNGIGNYTDADLVIPSSYNGKAVAAIGEEAFFGNTSITSVTIPESVTSIGSSAFASCRNLAKITVTDGITYIGGSVFGDTAYDNTDSNWTDGMLCLENYLLDIKSDVTDCVVPDNITVYADGVFQVYNLKNVTFGSGITSVADLTFEGNTSIENVVIGSNVTTIGEYAFFYCPFLESITIPASVTYIGSNAFGNCYSIENVNVTDISAWCKITFEDKYSNPLTVIARSWTYGVLTLNGGALGDVVLSDDVTQIPSYTFYENNTLTSIEIGKGFTSIDAQTFVGCSGLKSVVIPDTVTRIGVSAFFGCALESITIPDSVTSISESAFYDCTSITSISIGYNVKTIGSNAFHNSLALTEFIFKATAMDDFSSTQGIFYNAGLYSSGITVTISANVTRIPAYLFYPYSSNSYAPNVTSIVFEENSKCTEIGEYAFANCTSLVSFTNFPASASYDVSIVDGCTKLDKTTLYTESDNGYYFGTQFASVTDKTIDYLIIKDGTTSIAENALAECTGLRFVYIPESVTEIGDGALDFTTSYDSWTTIIYFESSKGADSISTSYTNWLGKYTTDTTATYQGISFTSNAYGFQFLCVASSKIDGDYIYRSEDGLSHASTSSDATAVTYAYFGTDTDVTVPSTLGGYTVSTVGGYTFAETDVTSVTLPSSVTYIGAILYLGSWGGNLGTNTPYNYGLNWMPFTACDKLTTVNINSSVVYILGYSFYGCTALTTINFASDCQGAAIYNNAFDGCTSLTSITLPELAVIYSGALTGSSLTSVTAGSGDTATICSLTVDTSAYTYSYSVLATVNQGTELATALTGTYLKQDTYINYDSLNS